MGRLTDTVKHLIIINVIFFLGSQFYAMMYDWFSLFYFENSRFQLWQPFSHMFMHSGFSHILFNMFGLFMFGSPLEAQWGKKKFLFFYFSAGLGAALIHTLVNYYHFQVGFDALLSLGATETEIWDLVNKTLTQGSYREIPEIGIDVSKNFFTSFNTPAVGASGAIYGVLVAFGLMYPNAELMMIFLPIPIKAKYFIPAIILMDLFSGLTGVSLFGQGIAHWAHLGGALFGFIMAYYWKKNSFNDHRWN